MYQPPTQSITKHKSKAPTYELKTQNNMHTHTNDLKTTKKAERKHIGNYSNYLLELFPFRQQLNFACIIYIRIYILTKIPKRFSYHSKSLAHSFECAQKKHIQPANLLKYPFVLFKNNIQECKRIERFFVCRFLSRSINE